MFPDFSDLADTGKKLVSFMQNVNEKLDIIISKQQDIEDRLIHLENEIHEEIENV